MKDYRVVDLSWKLTPPNPGVGGLAPRRLEMRRYTVGPGEYMFEVDTMSHIGTHVEVPSHFMGAAFPGQEGKDLSEMPVEAFLGSAYVVDVKDFQPATPVLPEHLEATGAGEGDILLIGNSPHTERGQKVYVSSDAAQWMVDRGIKMMGMEYSVGYEEPGAQTLLDMHTHVKLLSHDIPFLENMAHFDQLQEKHVFFIALPLNIVGMDSWPVRAVALEGIY
jgi:arylformamidase